MSKKIELIIEIDKKGKIKVTTKGTSGPECLEILAFLDKLEDLTVIETVHNEDMNRDHKDHIKNVVKDNNV